MNDTPLFVGKNQDSFSRFYSDAEPFDNMMDGRIPSLWTVQNGEYAGTVLTAADKASCGADWGYIEIAVRRSTDNGRTFDKMQTVFTPPVRKYPYSSKEYSSAFAIDPLFMEAADGRLLMLVDFYPECKGLHNPKLLEKGSGYKKINGEDCLILYSGKTKLDGIFAQKGREYTLHPDGFVYTPEGEKTRFYVPKNHDPHIAFATWGDMYYQVEAQPRYIEKAPPMVPERRDGKDIYVGNIFLSKGKKVFKSNVPDFVQKRMIFDEHNRLLCVETDPAPLRAPMISYIYQFESTDGGQTFSQPKDITAGYKKDSDGIFLGVGPGVGLTLQHGKHAGRILAPAYILNKALVLLSDNNGKTWRRNRGEFCENIDECQLVEMPDGKVFCFGRPRGGGKIPLSVSDDGGDTFRKLPAVDPKVPQCQRSVISLPQSFVLPNGLENDGRYILLSTPTGHGGRDATRTDGKVFFGRIDNETVTWIRSYEVKDKEKYADFKEYADFYAYSCLAALNDNTVGLFYEAYPSGYITFAKFGLE